MSNHEEKTENVSHRNEWEVLHDQDDSMNEEKSSSSYRTETYDLMYMSRHFVFPPSQHENLPLEPETYQVGVGDGIESIHSYEGKSYMEDEENLNIEESSISHYLGIPIFDEHGNIVAASGTELQRGITMNKEKLHNEVKSSSFHSESVADADNTTITESTKFFDEDIDSGVPSTPMHANKDLYESNLPCEAWWKKHAISIYVHAKNSNAFWSIFVATTVMGLVVVGQRWQQDRWKVLQIKLQLNINEEKMSKVLSPLIRFKDAIIGGYRTRSLIGGGNSLEH